MTILLRITSTITLALAIALAPTEAQQHCCAVKGDPTQCVPCPLSR